VARGWMQMHSHTAASSVNKISANSALNHALARPHTGRGAHTLTIEEWGYTFSNRMARLEKQRMGMREMLRVEESVLRSSYCPLKLRNRETRCLYQLRSRL
jgi:hypothetical protein